MAVSSAAGKVEIIVEDIEGHENDTRKALELWSLKYGRVKHYQWVSLFWGLVRLGLPNPIEGMDRSVGAKVIHKCKWTLKRIFTVLSSP